jgi:hypothetical protein
MPYKVIEQRDFGGGLNTAVDPTLLRPNESPEMMNVVVTDTNAITSRHGYSALTSTPVQANKSIRDLYRFYKMDGTKYWIVISGTRLYSAQDLVNSVPVTRKELSVANVTATGLSATRITSPVYSGGAAVSITKAGYTVTATVPYSNRLTLYGYRMTGSVKLDAGSWLSLTATALHNFGSITATTHTVSFKSKAANATSAKLTTVASATGYVSIESNAGYVGDIEWSFHDAGQSNVDWWVMAGSVKVGVFRSQSTTNYTMKFNNAGSSLILATRSVGWHTVRYDRGGSHVHCYLDGVKFYSYDISMDVSPVQPFAAVDNASTTANSVYFDRLTVNGVVVDDFTDLTGWDITKAVGTETAAASATYAVTTALPLIIDALDYSCEAGFTRYGTKLSATANYTGLATLNDKLYYGTAYDNVRSFTGATTAAISASGSSKAAFMTHIKRRLFAGGIATDQALMNYTDLDKGYNWSGGGAARLAGLDSGGECTGIAVLNNKLLWFGESRFYGLDTSGIESNWSAFQLADDHGCIAPRSLAVGPSAVYFLSADGVRAYGTVPNIFNADGSDSLPMSLNLRPTFDSYTDTEKRAAVGAVHNGRYYLALGKSYLYVCDLVKRTDNKQPVWTKYNYRGLAQITCMCVTRGDEAGLYCGTADGKIYRLDHGSTDNGNTIGWSYKMAPMAPGGFQSIKHFRTAHLALDAAESQALDVIPSTDDVSGTPVIVNVTGKTDSQPIRVPLSSRGRYQQLWLAGDIANQPITLSSVALTFVPPRMR